MDSAIIIYLWFSIYTTIITHVRTYQILNQQIRLFLFESKQKNKKH